jgi:hypothetical protein
VLGVVVVVVGAVLGVVVVVAVVEVVVLWCSYSLLLACSILLFTSPIITLLISTNHSCSSFLSTTPRSISVQRATYHSTSSPTVSTQQTISWFTS